MKRIFLPAFLVVLSLLPQIILAQPSAFRPDSISYLWPTDASPYLSSTFAETRASHFHAALDIKTWGRRGYKIYATRDGVVHRIAIGPKGYGKVIYLRHDDGSYSVYAHLLKFNNQLQQIADSTRMAEGYRFELDQFVGDRQIRVSQGEVIGYSGASGIGPPHLHFELRTPAHRPFNPLLTNLSVDDTIAPRIVGLSVEPKAITSSVENRHTIYTRRASKQGNQYEFGTVHVSGPVGLGLNVFDQSNGVHNVYAVYELSMEINGQEFFKAKADSFSYLKTHQMFIDRVYPLLQEEGKGFQRLYVAEGNSLPFYSTGPKNGILNLPPGTHHITIRARDFYGNASTASVQLQVEEKEVTSGRVKKSTSISQDSTVFQPSNWTWFADWVSIPEQAFTDLTIAIPDSGRWVSHEQVIGVPLRKENPLFMNVTGGTGPIVFHRIKPATGGIIASVNSDGFTHFPRNTFYDTVSVGMTINRIKKDSVHVQILPNAYPVREEFQFYVERDSTMDLSKLSFYKKDREHNEWDYIPTDVSDRYLIGTAETLGSFTTLRDTLAPVLYSPKLTKRRDGHWLIQISAKDPLSGIDYTRSSISVNGIRGIAEYEPEDDRLIYYHPEFTPSPEMEINVKVWDRMDNLTEKTFHLDQLSQ